MSKLSAWTQRAITPIDALVKQLNDRLSRIKYKVAILSGKGGVGKSFVSSMLGLALCDRGYRVALLDADLHGSSIPLLLGVKEPHLYLDEEGILPVSGPLNVRIVSMGLMLPTPETPVAWRGPMKSKAIVELLAKVSWGENDFLIIDLPPGTGDEAITIVQAIRDLDGAIVVTAPNVLSETVVSRAINFIVERGVRLLGIVENMSYFKCPDTGKVYYLLGKSCGEELARKYNTELLARIPFDPLISESLERREPYYVSYRDGEASRAIRELALRVVSLLPKK